MGERKSTLRRRKHVGIRAVVSFADGGSIICFTTCNVLVGIECVEMEIDKDYKESFF